MSGIEQRPAKLDGLGQPVIWKCPWCHGETGEHLQIQYAESSETEYPVAQRCSKCHAYIKVVAERELVVPPLEE